MKVPPDGWEWIDEDLADATDVAHGEPVKVGALADSGGGRNVFRGMVPAIKASDVGPGGRSHLVGVLLII